MLRIRVSNDKQQQQVEHVSGPLELGRGPQRDLPRILIDDLAVSRDQIRVEELADHRLRLMNLSQTNPTLMEDGTVLNPKTDREVSLPVRVVVGKTQIDIEPGAPRPAEPPAAEAAPAPVWGDLSADSASQTLSGAASLEVESRFDRDLFSSVPRPSANLGRPSARAAGRAPAEAKDSDTLTRWLETALTLQKASPGSPEFYQETSRAVVELIGLDLGLVILRKDDKWTIAGAHAADDTVSVRYSRTLLNHVATERCTVYQDISAWKSQAVSLEDVEALVAAPIFGLKEDVVGVLYGMRSRSVLAKRGVQPAEAQLVQLLAGVVGANLARGAAVRTRVQFEQFFSPDLVRELERDPNLLEGRSQEVTILFSDLRGFTVLSQRLGAQNTCRLVRDMMERLSERIMEQGGVIVDYAGDGILAMWNAPAKQDDHALRACRAALAMLAELHGLNAKWYDQAGGQLALGIGINTGAALVGNTGSSRKFKYGPHGHTVNLASRVQDATKKLGVPILVTGSTAEQVGSAFATRRLGRVSLPGVKEPVVLHELNQADPPPEWQARRKIYEEALALYEARQWSRACHTLMPLLEEVEKNPQCDAPTLKLMRRSWECLESRPENFEALIEVTTK